MATIYNIKMTIISDFCAYSKEEIKKIITEQIEKYKNPETGLSLRIREEEFIVEKK